MSFFSCFKAFGIIFYDYIAIIFENCDTHRFWIQDSAVRHKFRLVRDSSIWALDMKITINGEMVSGKPTRHRKWSWPLATRISEKKTCSILPALVFLPPRNQLAVMSRLR